MGLGFKDPRLTIETFNHRTLRLRDISLGPSEGPDIKVSLLSVEYDLSDLFHGRVRTIEVAGLEARALFKDGGLILPGLPIHETKDQSQDNGTTLPLILISKIKIDSSALDLGVFQKNIRVPFDCEITEKGAPGGGYEIRLHSSLLAQEILAKGKLDIVDGNGEFEISAAKLDLKAMKFFSNNTSMPLLQGGGEGKARFSLVAWKPEQVRGSLNLKDVNWEQEDFKIAGGIQAGFSNAYIKAKAALSNASWGQLELESPSSCEIVGPAFRELQMKCDPVKIRSPYSVALSDLSAKVSGIFSNPSLEGGFSLLMDKKLLSFFLPELSLDSSYKLQGVFSARPGKGQTNWGLNLEGKQAASGIFKETKLDFGTLGLKVFLKGNKDHASGSAELLAEDAAIGFQDFSADMGSMSLTGLMAFPFKGKGFQLDGVGKLKAAHISGPQGLSRLEGLEIEIPLGFAGQPAQGKFAIQKITAQGMEFKDVTGSICQGNGPGPSPSAAEGMEGILQWVKNFQLTGKGYVPLQDFLPGLPVHPRLNFSFAAVSGKEPGVELDFETPEINVPNGTLLDQIHPLLRGVKFSGGLAASGGIALSAQAARSHATIRVKDAELDAGDQQISMAGINTEINFKDLLNPATEPDQSLLFDNLAWGTLPVTHGKVLFEVESPESIFLRHGELQWGKGKISFDEVRSHPGKGEIDLVLNCDRISLSEMLNLLCAKKFAFGEGTISGRVPLRIKNGNIYVDKGFLNSVPGEKGVIQIEESSIISGGNLLVEEAAKDFSYGEVQVDLNSKGENMDILLSLKGAPNRTLPLLLDRKTKKFIKDVKGKGGVNLQGLHLDLRFKAIPLNELIKKKKLFREML